MPRNVVPRIVAVRPGEQPVTLRVSRNTGAESLIEFSSAEESYQVYAPLRQSSL